MTEESFEISMERVEAFGFDVDFRLEGVAPLRMDEPAPLGGGNGPNPARLLAAAVGNCLSASALFCLEKARIPVSGMRTTVRTSLGRNERGRVRIEALEVTVQPTVPEADRERIGRCLGLFEDFCMVTQSVRGGIDVSVDVVPQSPEAPDEPGLGRTAGAAAG